MNQRQDDASSKSQDECEKAEKQKLRRNWDPRPAVWPAMGTLVFIFIGQVYGIWLGPEPIPVREALLCIPFNFAGAFVMFYVVQIVFKTSD